MKGYGMNNNIVMTIEMYKRRLSYLHQEITKLVDVGLAEVESGVYDEEATFSKMSEFQDEINYIAECIDILEHLKKEG